MIDTSTTLIRVVEQLTKITNSLEQMAAASPIIKLKLTSIEKIIKSVKQHRKLKKNPKIRRQVF